MRVLPLVALIAVCAPAAPARAFVQYDVDGMSRIGGNEILQHPQVNVPPATVETFDFTYGGAACPASMDVPNYLCARMAGKADLVGSALSVHATSKIVRRNAVGSAFIDYVIVDSRITMSGFTASFPQLGTGYAAFYFGLHGTLASTPSTPFVTVETTVNASLFAPGLHEINCLSIDCPPLVVPTTTDPNATDAWNPASHLLTLRLVTTSRVTSTPGVDGWNVDSIADLGDTLSLLAIEPQDENHVPIAGHYTLPDVTGPGTMLDIDSTPPPPTTSTLPGATTTTSTTIAGATTTLPGATTTLPGATTTLPGATTTLPGATTTLAGATTTTTTLPGIDETCGNCVDDDADGLVDFEEPSCCPAIGVRAFALRKARLASARTGSKLSLTASIAGTALSDVAPGRDLFLQIHGGSASFCARIPADRLVPKHGKTAVFADPKHTVSDAGGISKVTLHAAKGALLVHLEAAQARLALPAAGPLDLVVAFAGDGANRCSAGTSAFRKAGKHGLRAP